MINLHYNASHPIEILESLTIKVSRGCGHDRGVSMSSQIPNSHGAFTFVFLPERIWYKQFREVKYGRFARIDELHKSDMFIDEKEWWSKDEVRFSLEDIEKIILRSNSPAYRIHPRICMRNHRKLLEVFWRVEKW